MKTYVCLLAALVFIACGSGKKETEKEADNIAEQKQNAALQTARKIHDKILGSFVGAFGDNKITLLLTRAEDDSVAGRSVVGGNDRPFTGTVTLRNGEYVISAAEPGDDKYDGQFSFAIKETNPDIVTGSWKPFNPGQTAEKNYTLQRRAFKYRIDTGVYPEASQRALKEADVENLRKEELQMMRNEIFARHGYCFKKKDMRQYFERLDWYVPDNVDVKELLTEIEKKNIRLIKRYEKYAEEYGDEFGR
jgi:YARHG domain